MDLQRPDSYQGGAGPYFNEQVLHKVKKKNLLPQSRGWERASSSVLFADFALGLKEKLTRIWGSLEDPFCSLLETGV